MSFYRLVITTETENLIINADLSDLFRNSSLFLIEELPRLLNQEPSVICGADFGRLLKGETFAL